jgi:hypothetical protein
MAKNKKLTTGAKKAIEKGEDLGVRLDNKTGGNFSGGGIEKPAGRARIYARSPSGPNVPVKGKVRNIEKNMTAAINVSQKKSFSKKKLG